MTAAAKPGQCEGGGALDCCTCDLVLIAGGGVTWTADVVTWALVCMQEDVLVGVVAMPSRTARYFQMHSCLVELVIVLVGVTLLSTLGSDGCTSMDHVILLLS